MAKGFAHSRKAFLGALFMGALGLQACSKDKDTGPAANQGPDVEKFPIAATQFKNCHFKDTSPTYTLNGVIPPNPIECDEGVAKKVELLTTNPLPNGLRFSMDQLSLTGTAGEKIASAPYQFYIENEAGYVILNLNLTVK